MDAFPEPYAFSDAVFIVRVRRAPGRAGRGDDLTIVAEDVTTGATLTFAHERELVAFLRTFVERTDRVA